MNMSDVSCMTDGFEKLAFTVQGMEKSLKDHSTIRPRKGVERNYFC